MVFSVSKITKSITISMWSTLQTSIKFYLTCGWYSAVLVVVFTLVVEQAVATPDNQVIRLISEKYPGFKLKEDSYLVGDFNGDGISDGVFLIFDDQRYWKLIVMFSATSAEPVVRELKNFPGKNSDWTHTSIYHVGLKVLSANHSGFDRFGLDVKNISTSLEYEWRDKTARFLVSRIHKSDTRLEDGEAEDKNVIHGMVTMQAAMPGQEEVASAYFDLDQQSTGKKSAADVSYIISGGSIMFYTLNPINGAVAILSGKTMPTYADCYRQQGTMSSDNLPDIKNGVNFCFRTNQNQLAMVQIHQADEMSLVLAYTLWCDN
ncbi:MAG: hypothetical protein P8179_02475 [Candidatus Thiodiazotropha sp.]|jgi:hypothetical protein